MDPTDPARWDRFRPRSADLRSAGARGGGFYAGSRLSCAIGTARGGIICRTSRPSSLIRRSGPRILSCSSTSTSTRRLGATSRCRCPRCRSGRGRGVRSGTRSPSRGCGSRATSARTSSVRRGSRSGRTRVGVACWSCTLRTTPRSAWRMAAAGTSRATTPSTPRAKPRSTTPPRASRNTDSESRSPRSA